MDNNQLLKTELCSAVLDVIGALVVVMDAQGQIVIFNKACEKLTEYTFAEVENKAPWELFVTSEEADKVKSVFGELTAGNFPSNHINYWLTKSGEQRLIEWSNTCITHDDGSIAYVIGTGIDITERKDAEDKLILSKKNLEKLVSERTLKLRKTNKILEQLVRRDSLTGLNNRRHFDSTLAKEVRRSTREKTPLTLMICDIDFFKSYNDEYGHIEGDKCLKEIARLLKDQFHRASDFVARYGGEEFVIILPGTPTKEAGELADNLLRATWEANIATNASSIADRVTISIGITTINHGAVVEAAEILHAADTALYDAKESGRNRVVQCTIEP